jgi:hypothetical protein
MPGNVRAGQEFLACCTGVGVASIGDIQLQHRGRGGRNVIANNPRSIAGGAGWLWRDAHYRPGHLGHWQRTHSPGARRGRRRARLDALPRILCSEHPQSAHAPGYAWQCPRGAGVSGVLYGRRCGVDARGDAHRLDIADR